MQRQTTISIWCERIIEGGWLLALTLIPIFFNLLSARHFEPDKAVTLRSLVLIMAAAALIRALEQLHTRSSSSSSSSRAAGTASDTDTPVATNPLGGLWKRLNSVPLAVPVAFYMIVYIIATITSVVPRTSLLGSYQRLQGTYTNFSYIILFFLIITTIRRREQLERLITVVLITGFTVGFYGVMQHNGLDPLPWQGDVVRRVASTMGNAIFVAAYLIMVVPLVLYRMAERLKETLRNQPYPSFLSGVLWSLAFTLLVGGTTSMLISAIKFGASVRVPDFRYWWVFPGAIVVSTALWVLTTLKLPQGERRPPVWPGVTMLGYLLLLGPTFVLSNNSEQQRVQDVGSGPPWSFWLFLGIGLVIVFYGLAYFLYLRQDMLKEPSQGTTIGGVAGVFLSLVVGVFLLAQRVGLDEMSLLAVICLGAFVLILSHARYQLGGPAFALAIILMTIFYSQSRGPWLGLSVGLFVFFSLLLWMSMRRASLHEAGSNLARNLKVLMGGWVLLTLAGIGFLVFVNFSNTAFAQDFRNIPYIGRAGTVFNLFEGTGLVRQLIWIGDEHGSGSVGLITAEPYRTVVGWGPESMFVAFNKFYPPELAHVEQRTASPDRAHQVILDQLITRGILGLVAYFFLLLSFVGLAWRIIRNSEEWHWMILGIACLSGVASHVVEGMTGIPIVSTLTMFWTLMGLTVVVGMMAGLYTIGKVETPAATATTSPSDERERGEASTSTEGKGESSTAKPAPSGKKSSRQSARGHQQGKRGASGRGASAGGRRASPGGSRAPAASTTRSQSGAGAWALYLLIALLALGGTWWFNISTIYADMRFHEAEAYEQSAPGFSGKIQGLYNYLGAIRNNPSEDFYYLSLGRNLMNIAEEKRVALLNNAQEQKGSELNQQEVQALLGQPAPDADVQDLLDLEELTDVVTFVEQNSPLELISYAEAVLVRAQNLNPMNKDHYANLGRLNNFWYNWVRNPERLEKSAEWYEEANTVAPQDVALINEHANVRLQLAQIALNAGNQERAQQHYARAAQLYARSETIDPGFGNAAERLPDIYRAMGDLQRAAEMYVQVIQKKPHQFDKTIESFANELAGQPELLRMLRDAYMTQAEQRDDAMLYAIAGLLSVRAGDVDNAVSLYDQAVELDPENLQHRLNYSIVLSDTSQYTQAITQAEEALTLAQEKEDNENQVRQIQQIIAYFESASSN